jgi:hypothetical protein
MQSQHSIRSLAPITQRPPYSALSVQLTKDQVSYTCYDYALVTHYLSEHTEKVRSGLHQA